MKKKKVLLVDDEVEIRELLKIYLTNYGYLTYENLCPLRLVS